MSTETQPYSISNTGYKILLIAVMIGAFVAGVMATTQFIEWRGAGIRTVAMKDQELASCRQTEANWKRVLVEREFAEYDRKTGEWHLLTKQQVLDANAAPPDCNDLIMRDLKDTASKPPKLELPKR